MRKAIVIAILLIAGLSLAAWQRNTIVRFALTTILAHSVGDGATIGSLRFSGDHLLINDLLVTRRLRPVLTIRAADVTFSWRDLLPGSAHRFGLRRIDIADAHFTIIRFADGTLTIPLHRASGNGSLRAPIATPLVCDIHIRNSQVTITDDLDHAGQGIKNFNADIMLQSNRESTILATGVDAENAQNRLNIRGIVSQTRNFASLDAQLPHMAARGLLDALIGSQAIRFARGDLDAITFHAGSFSVSEGVPTDLSYALTADVRNASITLPWLAKPITNISGPVTIVDGIISTPSLAATISGTSIDVGGGVRIGEQSHIALRVDARGDLSRARQALTYLRGLPLSGAADVHLDIRGLLDAPHLAIAVAAPSAHYGDFPLDRVQANFALEAGHIVVARFDARYQGIPLRVRGSLVPGDHLLSEFAIHAATIGANLPYLAQLRPHEPIVIDAVMRGTDLRFTGTALARDPSGATVAFAQSWPDGRLRVAPLWIHKGAAELAGGYTQDRSAQTSAAWLFAHGLAVRQPPNQPFAGLTLPDAPFAGRLDAAVALRTHRAASALAMRAQLTGGTVGSMAATRINGSASGSLQTLAIDPVVADFPWGNFVGRGLSQNGQLLLAGRAHANLAAFPLPLGSPTMTGQSDGPVTLALDSRGLGVWVPEARLQGVAVDGVPVTGISGHVEFVHGATVVDRLFASAGGGSVSLLGGASGGPISFAARGIDLASLGRLRPGDATGRVTAFGTVDSANPQNADFTASLSNGRVGGYAVAGSAAVGLRGTTLSVAHGLGRIDGLPAAFAGRVWSLGQPSPSYDLTTHVPAADLATVVHAFGVRTNALSGTFRSDFHVTGRGSRALVDGPVDIPISLVLGQSVHDARATLIADPQGVTVTDGTLRVGTTNAQFFALSHRDVSALAVVAHTAHLADFNDLFDTGDTFGGNGSLDVALLSTQHRISSDGVIDIHHLQFRRFPFGHTAAKWTSSHDTVDGTLAVHGRHGQFAVQGSLSVAPTARLERLLASARYDATLTAKDLDLSLYRTLVGAASVPLLGSLDGKVTAHGRLPNLQLQANAVLHRGSFGATPIDQLSVGLSDSGDRFTLSNATLSAVGLQATAGGSFGWQPTSPLALTVAVHAAQIHDVIARSSHRVLPISGSVDSTVLIRGTTAKPTFTGAVDAKNLDVYGVVLPSLVGSGKLVGSKLQVQDVEANFGTSGMVTLAGSLPLRLWPFSIGGATDRLSFDLAVDKLHAKVFAPLLGSKTTLGGQLNGRIGLSGLVGSPQAIGHISLSDGSYAGPYNATSIGQIGAGLLFSGTKISISSLHAMVGGGVVRGDGIVDLAAGLNDPKRMPYSAHLRGQGARLDIPGVGRGALDFNVALTHAASSKALLSGDIAISNAAVPFAAFLVPAVATTGARAFDLAFDLALRAGQNVRVVGSGYGAGLDIAGTGSVALRGTLAQPTLEGSFVASGGTLTYLDRAFSVVRARVAFHPDRGLVPNLTASAQTRVTESSSAGSAFGATEITVAVSGPIDHLTVDLQSNPPGYSRDQLLAMLTPLGGLAGVGGSSASLRGGGGTTIGQEAFNLVNAQFTSALLGPLGNALGKSLGLGNVGLSFDYFGNLAVSVNRPLSHGFSLSYSSTFGLVSLQTLGIEYAPKPSTIAQLAFYTQTVAPSVSAGLRPVFFASNGSLSIPLQSGSGFSFTLRRLFGWRRSSKEQPPTTRTGPAGM